MTIQIKGLQKTCLIDYPPYTSCVVFLPGCNFRCPFCQNPDLILNQDRLETIEEKDFFDFLKKRKDWLEGAVITGGEPCIYEDLPIFIKKIKELGYKIKLDTNGTNPKMIQDLIEKKLVDYIAMDIKSSLENYDKSANARVDKEKIKESVKIIIKSGIDYEFRMTVVPKLHDKSDFESIGKWLKGAKKFFIQQFSSKSCLDKEFEKIKPFSKHDLEEFKAILSRYMDKVDIR